MTINFFNQDGHPFAHIIAASEKVTQSMHEGHWMTVELQPDLFVPQHFSVGVIFYDGDRLHYHLLSDFSKFDCIYGSQLNRGMISDMLGRAEEVLRNAAQAKLTIDRVDFGSANIFISAPAHTSGESSENIVLRLYQELIILEPHEKKKQVKQFDSMDTPKVRALVNEALKRLARNDYEKIVLDTQEGIIVPGEGGHSHYFDINLKTKSSCGSVVSAVYKTPNSTEMNLLRANLDLSTYARMQNLKDKGVFMMLPERSKLQPAEWNKIENVVGEQSWKLERDGFRVVGLDTADGLAEQIYEWARPTL